ncbi:MAG TPA: TIGR03364 family FAD-dependent oxidoreductase [Solirubrobacteraceae bacterium]|nr:TIGR03364 family FAD-dependent oxidoreductase [Solirubrobacteraceae bacterium]
MSALRTIDADVCVVGAGIVGVAHALEARERGLSVVVIDRARRAVGASVRNFGHGCVAAMADDSLECALDSRRRWIELGRRAGLEVILEGSVVVGRHDDELAVLEAVAADQRRGARVLTPTEVGSLAPIPIDGVRGGMHAALDFRVDPRQAVARLTSLLEEDADTLVLWESSVHDVCAGVVESARARVRAPIVLLCPGPDFASLPLVSRGRDGLTLCKLQMLRVAAPAGRRYGPALLTGLSLLRYPAFTSAPDAARVRERFDAERPELIAAGIHLIITQLPGGDLILGDSHDYCPTVSPFREERIDELLLAEASALLGAPQLDVRERWLGVYPSAPGPPFLIHAPLPGVRLVEVVSGIGMTTALGLAIQVLDAAVSDLSELPATREVAPPEAPPRSAEAHAGCGS